MTREVRLHMFYVGGNAGRSNLEVHDVQFAAVASVEEAIPALRAAWFGDADKLHLDGYTVVGWADGHAVSLARRPCGSGLRLYFVNMGGYRPDSLAEVHEFGLFVATDANRAKAKAKASLLAGADIPHKDNLKDIDQCLALAEFDGWHVQLTPDPDGRPDLPAWQGYRPIGA